MIRVFFAALVPSLLIALVFPPAFVPAFIILIVLIGLTNVGKLKCSHCGKRVKLNMSVCHHCGREVKNLLDRVAKSQPRTAQSFRGAYCSGCGATLDPAAFFCSRCGAGKQAAPPSSGRSFQTAATGTICKHGHGVGTYCYDCEFERVKALSGNQNP